MELSPRVLEWLGSTEADVVGQPLESILTLRMPLSGTDGVRPTDATLHGASGVVRPVVVGSLDRDDARLHRLVIFDVAADPRTRRDSERRKQRPSAVGSASRFS